MKTAHLTWEEVEQQAAERPIIVHYDGIQRSGYCREEHMWKLFRECELLRLTMNDYQVMKWPDRRKA